MPKIPYKQWVVICFHFTIFVVLETTKDGYALVVAELWFAFILLSLSYWKQQNNLVMTGQFVVICFHFTIFVVLETTPAWTRPPPNALWFAFILLSLSYWKQLGAYVFARRKGCDLLSFYYLCRTGNNCNGETEYLGLVVICFHFTIFVVLETTRRPDRGERHALWFAFILLSLSYWKQRDDGSFG